MRLIHSDEEKAVSPETDDARAAPPDDLQEYLQARPRLLLTVLDLLEKYDAAVRG